MAKIPALVAVAAMATGAISASFALPASAQTMAAAEVASGVAAGIEDGAGLQDPPGLKGWLQVSQGVFVYSRSGDPSLVERFGRARVGRNLTLRVGEDARLHRVLRNGDVNLIDRSTQGRLRLPGDRVHNRGAMMFVSAAGVQPPTVRAQSTSGRYAWVYVDTDARVNNRGWLVTGGLFEPNNVKAVLRRNVDATVKVWAMIDISGSSFFLTKGVPFTADSKRFFGETSNFGLDKTSSLEINIKIGNGSPIHMILRNPDFGRPDVTIESSLRPEQGLSKKGFSEQYRCYYTVDDPSVTERYAFVVKRDDDTDTKNFEIDIARADSVIEDFGYMERCVA